MVRDCVKKIFREKMRKIPHDFRRSTIPVCGLLYPFTLRFQLACAHFSVQPIQPKIPISCSCSYKTKSWHPSTYTHTDTHHIHLTSEKFMTSFRSHEIKSLGFISLTLVFEILHLQFLFSFRLFCSSWFTGVFRISLITFDGWWYIHFLPDLQPSLCTLCVYAILRYYQNDFSFVSFKRNIIRCVCRHACASEYES